MKVTNSITKAISATGEVLRPDVQSDAYFGKKRHVARIFGPYGVASEMHLLHATELHCTDVRTRKHASHPDTLQPEYRRGAFPGSNDHVRT
jgi:hypothetical protein